MDHWVVWMDRSSALSICYSHQILTQLKTCGGFYSVQCVLKILSIISMTPTEKIYSNAVHSSNTVQETCWISASEHWSCSGSLWWPCTLRSLISKHFYTYKIYKITAFLTNKQTTIIIKTPSEKLSFRWMVFMPPVWFRNLIKLMSVRSCEGQSMRADDFRQNQATAPIADYTTTQSIWEKYNFMQMHIDLV